MPDQPPSPRLHEPILVSAKEAAPMIGLPVWTVYKLLREGKIRSGYEGTRRLIPVEALREYAANLPSTPPNKEAS